MSMKNSERWLWSNHSKYIEEIKRNNSIINKPITLAVTGGKGGVGKTSVALKFALELSRKKNVLLIDCDHNLSNTLIKLGAPLNDYFYELITSLKNFDECLYKEGKFHLLSGCNGNLGFLNKSFDLAKFVIDIMVEHEKEYDHIILDCPAGLSADSMMLSAYCDNRIFVVTPDKSSLTDSYSLMKILSRSYGVKENYLLVNKIQNLKHYHRVVKTISETAECFLSCRTHILGGIQKREGNSDLFDEDLLSNKNSIIHKNFTKVIKIYAEKPFGSLGKSLLVSSKKPGSEQDVHEPTRSV